MKYNFNKPIDDCVLCDRKAPSDALQAMVGYLDSQCKKCEAKRYAEPEVMVRRAHEKRWGFWRD